MNTRELRCTRPRHGKEKGRKKYDGAELGWVGRAGQGQAGSRPWGRTGRAYWLSDELSVCLAGWLWLGGTQVLIDLPSSRESIVT